MRSVRILLYVVIALVVLLIVAAGVGLNSGFQTWAARRAVAGQKDLKAEIGRVSVGLDRVELSSIRIARPGMVLVLPSAVIDVPVIKAARKHVAVRRLYAHGWTLDLTAPDKLAGDVRGGRRGLAGYLAVLSSANAEPAVKSDAFHGIFSELNFPVDLSVDALDLAGDIIFPAEAGRSSRARIVITGGGLGSGREAKFIIQADASGSGTVSALSCNGSVGLHMDTPSSIDRVTFGSDLRASGASMPNGAALRLELAAARGPQRTEQYALQIESDGKSLVKLDAALPAGGGRLSGKIQLAARDADLAPFALGYSVPEFDAKTETTFELTTTFDEIAASGRIDLSLGRLEVLQRELARVGSLRLSADFSVEKAGDLLRVRSLKARVDGNSPVLQINARQSFEYDGKSGEIRVTDAGSALMTLDVESFPLEWIQPFLGKTSLSGGEARGAFAVMSTSGGFALRPQGPMTISPFSLSDDGRPIVRDATLSLSLSADVTSRGWQAEVTDFSARSGKSNLMTLSIKAGQSAEEKEPLKATGAFSVDLPALLAQPLIGGTPVLSRGTMSGRFTATSGAAQDVAAEITLSDLASPAVSEVLPKVSVEIRGRLETGGAFAASVPVLVERAGRKSDLMINARGKTVKTGVDLDARVSSTEMNVEDVKFLLAPFAGGGPTTEPAPQSTQGGGPPWEGVGGGLSFDFQKVIYSPDLSVRDLKGSLSISDTVVTLKELNALLGPGGKVALTGDVTFNPSRPTPFHLKADLDVTGLDSGATLKAFSDGSALPVVEGKFNISSEVTSSGESLARLFDQASGGVKVSSRGGLFRPVPSNYVNAISAARAQLLKRTDEVGAIASIAGVLGARLPGGLGGAASKAHAVAERLGELEAIVKLIAELKFDQLTLDAGGSTSMDTVLRDLTITSPELRFVGSGGLKYRPDVPIWKQALTLKLSGAARGRAAEIMKKGNLLGDTRDSLGYIPLSLALNISGTAEKPDISRIVAALFEKVLSMKLSSGDIEKIQHGDIGAILNLLAQLK